MEQEREEQQEKKTFVRVVGKFFRTLWSILSGLPGIVAGVTLLASFTGFFVGTKALQPNPGKRVSSSPTSATTPGVGPGEGAADASSVWEDQTGGGPAGGASGGVGSAGRKPFSGPTRAGPAPVGPPDGSSPPASPGETLATSKPTAESSPTRGPAEKSPAGNGLAAPVGGAPPAASGTGLAGYTLGGQHVLYVDTNQHVQELFLGNGASRWEHYDQSQLVGAPRAARNSGLAGYTQNGVNYAAYVDEAGHVRGLEWTPTVHKPATDLTASAQAPPAASGTGLAGYTLGGQHVLYVDTNQHVRALWRGDGASNWESFDHTAAAGVAPAASGSGLAGYALNGVNYAAYADGQGHVRGLQWTISGTKPVAGLTG